MEKKFKAIQIRPEQKALFDSIRKELGVYPYQIIASKKVQDAIRKEYQINE